jgi:putative transposase
VTARSRVFAARGAAGGVAVPWAAWFTSGGAPGGRRRGGPGLQGARLGEALDAYPAACGWNQGLEQRWTLARVAALISRLFGVSYTLRGTSYLLHRLEFSPQVPAHRAAERDETKIAEWRTQVWAKV